MKNLRLYSTLTLVLLASGLLAQERYSIDNSSSNITILGTSNVHDWEMNATGMNAHVDLLFEADMISEIKQAAFKLPAENIKSHNSIMDKKTREAIKTNKYKYINFELATISNLKVNGNNLQGTASGKLTIAGKSQNISVPFTGDLNAGKINIKGTKQLNLKDFNISPPTAMMGTLKTSEIINIDFNLHFNSTGSDKRVLSSGI